MIEKKNGGGVAASHSQLAPLQAAQAAPGTLLVSFLPPGHEQQARAIFRQLADIPGCYAEAVMVPLPRMMNADIMAHRCAELGIVGAHEFIGRFAHLFRLRQAPTTDTANDELAQPPKPQGPH